MSSGLTLFVAIMAITTFLAIEFWIKLRSIDRHYQDKQRSLAEWAASKRREHGRKESNDTGRNGQDQ